MTIKPISECPNPLEGVYNPPDALKYACGYRIVPPLPVIPDGYTQTFLTLTDGDGVTGAWSQGLKLTAEIEQESKQADLIANGTRYLLQNQYMTMCGQLTGQAPCKLGFGELQSVIESLMATDPNTAVALSLKLLTLDAALKREGGLQWWDACNWTEGL
jgi:hypothetical protein